MSDKIVKAASRQQVARPRHSPHPAPAAAAAAKGVDASSATDSSDSEAKQQRAKSPRATRTSSPRTTPAAASSPTRARLAKPTSATAANAEKLATTVTIHRDIQSLTLPPVVASASPAPTLPLLQGARESSGSRLMPLGPTSSSASPPPNPSATGPTHTSVTSPSPSLSVLPGLVARQQSSGSASRRTSPAQVAHAGSSGEMLVQLHIPSETTAAQSEPASPRRHDEMIVDEKTGLRTPPPATPVADPIRLHLHIASKDLEGHDAAAVSAPTSRQSSKTLKRSHVSYSGVPMNEETEMKHDAAAPLATPRTGGDVTPISRSRRSSKKTLRRTGSSMREKIKLVSFQINHAASIAAGHFPTNFIKTSKYTILTFLPVNLFEQFRRLANAYFLFIVLIQTIPGVSPFPIYTSVAPLVFILAVGALNEAREDFGRHKADAVANSRPCLLVTNNHAAAGGAGTEENHYLKSHTSAHVEVGQILRIENNQEFPADLVLLHTSREDGTCYVNTANLDGEAAPKVRSASVATQTSYDTPHKLLNDLRGKVQYEAPNASLYRFQGNVLLPDPVTGIETLYPLGDRQLLLRGAKLVNTEYIYGLVVYTGVQTKMMLNRNPARFKFSHFETQLNRCVLVSLGLNLIICLIPSIFYIYTDLRFAEFWGISKSDGLGWLLGFITLYILFSFMVPQSLYVTIELVKVGQAKFMEWDQAMGWTDPSTGEYRRCTVKSSALNEELGAVDVICTDKTGTLTSNVMELSRCSIAGALYFENETHRSNYIVSKPQSDKNLLEFGPHKLMEDVAREAFEGWIRGVDEKGIPIFAEQETNAEESSSASGSASSTVSTTSPAARAAIARDFLLNILLCNNVLPSWKSASGDKARQSVFPIGGAQAAAGENATKKLKTATSDATASQSGAAAEKKQLVFESQSPDEIALLQALQRIGITLTQRSGDKLKFDIELHPTQRLSALAHARSSVFALHRGHSASNFTSPPRPAKQTLVYTVLATLEFASAWRRNSVIVRAPDGRLMLYTKGADTTIAELISKKDPVQQRRLKLVLDHATEFAGTGSRTLVFACKPISQEAYDAWWPIYDAAQNAFNERDQQIERAFAQIETEMQLLGCSAVDDQLQELVPSTVDFLLAANLQIIVLTGDKQETGVSIAKQAHLIKPHVHILYVSATTSQDVGHALEKLIAEIDAHQEAANRTIVNHENRMEVLAVVPPASDAQKAIGNSALSISNGNTKQGINTASLGSTTSSPESVRTSPDSDFPANRIGGYALAIDGVALELALLYHRPLFQQIFSVVEAVVSYRSTPMQKALVVKLMKETGKTCLAIGDGANDVSMIQESHVGIGILGKEGAHAAMSSDFVITRFHHLRRLLCVHGRYNYWRTTQVVLMSFYKNLAFPLPLFWYTFYSMGNGTTAFDSLLITTFNTFFTSLPPFCAGLFDKDVSEPTLMHAPKAFDAFKKQSPFTVKSFVYTLISATYQSAVFYFFAHFMNMPGGGVISRDGTPDSLAVFGNTMITSVVITTNLTMFLALSAPNWLNVCGMAIGFALFLAVFVFESVDYQMDLAPDGYGMGDVIFGAPSSWLYFLFTLVLALLPNLIIEIWLKLYYPLAYQQLQQVPKEVVDAVVAAEREANEHELGLEHAEEQSEEPLKEEEAHAANAQPHSMIEMTSPKRPVAATAASMSAVTPPRHSTYGTGPSSVPSI